MYRTIPNKHLIICKVCHTIYLYWDTFKMLESMKSNANYVIQMYTRRCSFTLWYLSQKFFRRSRLKSCSIKIFTFELDKRINISFTHLSPPALMSSTSTGNYCLLLRGNICSNPKRKLISMYKVCYTVANYYLLLRGKICSNPKGEPNEYV
jgi:hypothetical protein